MVNVHTTFSHNFLKVTIGTGIAHVKENGVKDNTTGKMSPFEIDRQTQSPHSFMRTEGIIALQKSKIRDRSVGSHRL